MKVFCLSIILLSVFFTGCIHEVQDSKEVEETSLETWLDQTSILPDWKDGEYHDYYLTTELLNDS